jgi:biopolymer transport protein ExbD
MPAPQDSHHANPFFAVEGAVIEHRRTRQRHARGPAKISLAMTSMIDVVFLLLIYFLVATDFRMGEELYRMDLPNRDDAGSGADPFTLDDQPLRILVNSTGLGPDMYQLRIDGPYPQPPDFESLHAFLQQKQVNPENASIGSGAMFESDHPVVIQPTKATRWEHAMEAFNAAARARYTNVTFAKPG